jgi:metallophosphoesterase superfamily enzyme
MGYRFIEQVWLEADLNLKKIAMKYKLKNKDQLPKLIVMPAFNQFSGGIAINRQRTNSDENDKQGLGPLVRASEIENADVYLLEGLFIGKLKEI